MHQHSTEVCGVECGGLHEGEKRNFYSSNFLWRKRNFTGESFWARGYFVSTVGLDEEVVREYIRHQEKEGQRLEQLNLSVIAPTLNGGSTAQDGEKQIGRAYGAPRQPLTLPGALPPTCLPTGS